MLESLKDWACSSLDRLLLGIVCRLREEQWELYRVGMCPLGKVCLRDKVFQGSGLLEWVLVCRLYHW